MRTSGNTVLITGGASGIGLALAQRFLQAGSEVVVCGRREEKLREAQQKFPELHTRVCDVSDASNREDLFSWTTKQFPAVNVLVNNAGIQQRVNLLSGHPDWHSLHQEIAANLEGPVHLTTLFIPHFLTQENSAIINVSSGLAVTPAVWAPVYSATKAGLHSFTRSLRIQLSGTNTSVVEILPPAVNTDLGGPGLHTFGAPLNDFADSVFAELSQGIVEIGYGSSKERLKSSHEEIERGTRAMWENFLKNNPDFLR
ncbi:SDR family NAD(P)-dependent oxidoreductase [Alicyclobacillus tolerans]|uniref:SDR family oxidoreductase n=1 Tax=Alicyclobacillus tolerans TaxID=90970 RepID=UPI001F2C358A|nr:SDR family NAD(P)-dependent oxidoreductase [Alicyclobacillus tolerans]MCF8568352.1 SDR family NAD(P)-dependent oxidoreductase [Alicyclobacillus tolerans]